MSSHTDGLGCLECGQWVCECESADDYWKARAEKLEDELKEWMVTAEANEAEVQELKNTNAELRKARGCDEIIFEQLKHKKEKAEARVKELEDCVEENIVFLKWLDDMGFICDGWSNVNKAKEKYEKWKQAKEQEG